MVYVNALTGTFPAIPFRMPKFNDAIEWTMSIQPEDEAPTDEDFPEISGARLTAMRQRFFDNDVPAWCYAQVCASITVDGERFLGYASLGSCSYDCESDLWADNLGDLKLQATDDLINKLHEAVKTGKSVEALLTNDVTAASLLERIEIENKRAFDTIQAAVLGLKKGSKS